MEKPIRMVTKEVREAHCKKCDFIWNPTCDFPKQCPKCKSPNWTKPPRYKKHK